MSNDLYTPPQGLAVDFSWGGAEPYWRPFGRDVGKSWYDLKWRVDWESDAEYFNITVFWEPQPGAAGYRARLIYEEDSLTVRDTTTTDLTLTWTEFEDVLVYLLVLDVLDASGNVIDTLQTHVICYATQFRKLFGYYGMIEVYRLYMGDRKVSHLMLDGVETN